MGKAAGAWRWPPTPIWRCGQRKTRAIPPLPLWAFIAYYRVNFTFTFYISSAWTWHTHMRTRHGAYFPVVRLPVLHKITTTECLYRRNKDSVDETMKLGTGNINKRRANGHCSRSNDEIRCVFKLSEDDLSEVINHCVLRCKSPRSLKRLAAS